MFEQCDLAAFKGSAAVPFHPFAPAQFTTVPSPCVGVSAQEHLARKVQDHPSEGEVLILCLSTMKSSLWQPSWPLFSIYLSFRSQCCGGEYGLRPSQPVHSGTSRGAQAVSSGEVRFMHPGATTMM